MNRNTRPLKEFRELPCTASRAWRCSSTGDELRDIDEPARAGSIVNSNAHALAAMIREAGLASQSILPNVPDDLDKNDRHSAKD